jgi:hypothetical protein
VLAGGIAREFGNRQCAGMRRQNGHKGGHFALCPGVVPHNLIRANWLVVLMGWR